MTKSSKNKLKTIEVQAYELTCKTCGKKFYSINPRTKICDDCKASHLHERTQRYYQEVLKQKRQESRAKRKEDGIKVKCKECGKVFLASDGRAKLCPHCKQKQAKKVLPSSN